MVGISSLSLSWADSLGGAEAAASGIGVHFRSRLGRRGRRRRYGCLARFGSGDFSSFQLFGGRRIEDAAGELSERGLERRQNLLAGEAAVERIDFGLDLRAEFVGGAPELVQEARDLAADLGHFLGAEKDQRQKKNEDHLAGEAEIHTSIIMRDGRCGPLASWGGEEVYKAGG